MDTRKSITIVAALGVLLAVLLVLKAQNKKSNQANPGQDPNPVKSEAPANAPKFVMGNLTKVEGKKIYFNSQGEKTAIVSGNAKIVKQVKGKDKAINLVDIAVTELKAGNVLVVYYETEPSGSEYQATKIQVIN